MEELSPEDEEARMMALMGFGGFDSTKVTKTIEDWKKRIDICLELKDED